MSFVTDQTIQDLINQNGAVVNLGQVSPAQARALDGHAKRGELVKYRGYWNTLLTNTGMGPLKTIWALPSVAAHAKEMSDGIAGHFAARAA